MFIDYITLMLLNMVAGLVLASGYVVIGLGREDRKAWAPAFFVVAAVALSTGLAMTLTWPVPNQVGSAYNMVFGEMTVVLGAVFLGAAIAVARNVPMMGIGIYAAVGGLIAILLGVRILHLSAVGGIQFTAMPPLSAAGFIAAGLGAVLLPLALTRKRIWRILDGIVLMAAALLWFLVAAMGYWAHMMMLMPKPA